MRGIVDKGHPAPLPESVHHPKTKGRYDIDIAQIFTANLIALQRGSFFWVFFVCFFFFYFFVNCRYTVAI